LEYTLPAVTGPDTSRLDVTTEFAGMLVPVIIMVPAEIDPFTLPIDAVLAETVPLKFPIISVFAVILELPAIESELMLTGDAVMIRLPETIVVPPPPPPFPIPPIPCNADTTCALKMTACSSVSKDIFIFNKDLF
jgi:hypothetical protein